MSSRAQSADEHHLMEMFIMADALRVLVRHGSRRDAFYGYAGRIGKTSHAFLLRQLIATCWWRRHQPRADDGPPCQQIQGFFDIRGPPVAAP